MSTAVEHLRKAVTEISNALEEYEASELNDLQRRKAYQKLTGASQTLGSLLATPEKHWVSHINRLCILICRVYSTNRA